METKRNQKVNMRIRGKVKENLRKLENNLTQWNIRGKAMEKLQKKKRGKVEEISVEHESLEGLRKQYVYIYIYI